MAVRVLWVVKGLGPGGAETLLAAAAEAHDRSRFEVECAYVLPHKDHLAERLERAGVRTTCISRTRSDRWWPLRLARLVRGGQFDVVHVHSPLPGSVARLAVRSMVRQRPRVVTTEHNAWGTFATPTRVLNRWTSSWDDATFAVSDEVRNSMRGATRRRAVTLVHGIDVAAVVPLRAERDSVRAELAIGPDEFVIGTVANFREQKDYPTLLRAAREFLDRGGRAKWLIVGQGPLERRTRQLAAELGLSDVVTFTGFRADAARVQSAFDVFTLSSQWEGLPVALMEALAVGTPIAATAVGGVVETLTHGESALLVPPGEPAELAEAWSTLQRDGALRRHLGITTMGLADRFDVRRAQSTIESTYSTLLPGGPVRTSAPTAKSSPRRPTGLHIRELTENDEPAVLALLGRSLGWDDDPRFRDLYRWKHIDNVFGPSFGWVATDAERIVGVRLFMRWNFVRGGETLRAVRAVDTATDPEYQGRGLFTALTMHGLEEIGAQGIDFVFNTPNGQSKPGYLKMGWKEVGRLPAAVQITRARSIVRLARARTAADHWSIPLGVGRSIEEWLDTGQFPDVSHGHDIRGLRTSISPDFVRWRYGMPHLAYRVVGDGDGAAVVRARRRGAALELVTASVLGQSARATTAAALSAAREVNADHVLRITTSRPAGFATVRALGPTLTWREVSTAAMPPIANWAVEMGDIELM